MESKSKFHYGWVIAIMCLLMTFCTAFLSTGLGIVLAALRNTMGLTGTETSMILTIRSVSAFVVTLFAGTYFGKLGLRGGTSVAMFLGASVFVIFYLANGSVPVYYAGAVIAGFAYAFGLMLPAGMLIQRWFNKSRAVAISMACAGTAMCSMVGAPLVQWIINAFGLAAAFGFQVVLLAVVGVLLFLLVRDTPEKMGLEPYGGAAVAEDEPKAKVAVNADKPSLGMGWIVATAIACVLIGVAGSPATAHIVLCFTGEGFDSMLVATGLSAFGVLYFLGSLVYGRIANAIGTKRSSIIFGLIVTVGLGMCVVVGVMGSTVFMFATFAVLGIGYPVLTQGYPAWASDFSKPEDYDKTLKRFQLGYQAGAMIGSPVPGIIADLTGTYTWAYLVFSVFYGITVVVVYFAYQALARKRKAQEASAPVGAAPVASAA